jgi:hypothetical protein
MARGMWVEMPRRKPRVSNGLATGRGAIEKECATIAELAALQTGQKWEEAADPAVRSAQKWNWAPRKMTARSRARARTRRAS